MTTEKNIAENETVSVFSYKKDWCLAQKRWDAYWELEPVDRPVLRVFVPRQDAKIVPLPAVNSVEEKWMNPEYLLAKAINYLESNLFMGEAVPRILGIMAGTTAGCNGNLDFSEGGISIRPTMSSIDSPLNWHPGPDDPWRPKIEAILNLLLNHFRGKAIMAHTGGQFQHFDLLNMIRGNSEIMLDLVMNPEQCEARLKEIRMLSDENDNHFEKLIDDKQGNVGYVTWTGVWSRQPLVMAQADAAACISPEMFRQFVLPELDHLAERYERMHWHTCGYKQHLNECLSRPYIRGIQYSPNLKEPGNGPAHLEFYRAVQKAGRCLDIDGVDEADLEFLIRHLRPEGLCIGVAKKNISEAETLLSNAVTWAGSHAKQCF